ncbi:MAG: hypothetical protein H7Z21_20005, partial [Hymenobacter sp.]|nr:hypothetical protein [Hymenobacter sp.]
MNSFTEPLRRHAVTIGLSLLLMLGVAYYALGYLPAREEYLRGRYFRVMSRIGENLQEKERAYGKRADAMRREIQHDTYRGQPAAQDTSCYAAVVKNLRREWQQQGLNTPAFEELTHLPKAEAGRVVGELTKVRWVPARQRVRFEYTLDTLRSIVSSAGIADFVHDLLRPDAFRHFLIIGPAEATPAGPHLNQVYYSSFPAPVELPAGASAPRWLRDSTGIMATRQAELTINGQSYQLFVQPLRLRGAATWLLAGAVPTTEFRSEQRALPDNVLEVSLAVILLGLLALPYLKIVFMNARERLSHADVVLCCLSLVFGTTFLVLLSLSPVAKYDIEPDILDAQLRQLSEAVETTLRQELRAVRQTLNKAEAGLRTPEATRLLREQETSHAALRQLYQKSAKAPDDNYVPANKLFLAAVDLRRITRTRTWQPTDRIQWLDARGEGLIFVDNLPTRFNPSLQDRDYVRQAQQGNLWIMPPDLPPVRLPASPDTTSFTTFPAFKWSDLPDRTAAADTLFRLASVVRYGRQGDKAAVFVRPSRQRFYEADWARPSVAVKDSSLRSVLSIYTTQLRSLTAPVLPPGYSFCLMDERGEVQFHSDARLNLSENLLQDAEPADLLRTALLTHEATQGIIQYQGHYQRICVRQLGTWPLYLVTMADLRAVQARQMQTLSLAATLLGTIGLGHLLFVGLYVLVLPRRRRMLDLRYSLRRLWPRPEREAAYWRLVAALVGGAGLLVLFADFTPPTAQLFLLVLLPVYIFGFGFWQLQLPTDKATRALARVRTLVLTVLVSYNALALYWTGPRWSELTTRGALPWGCIVLFQLALLAWLWTVHGYLSKESQQWLTDQTRRKLRTWRRTLSKQVRRGWRLMTEPAAGLRLGLIAAPVLPFRPVPVADGAPPPATPSTLRRPYHWFKRAYALMLLGWLVVISVLPAIYCYHLAYRIEREVQLHYAHLRLGQQLRMAQARAEAEGLSDWERQLSYAYLPFFFATHYEPVAVPKEPATRYTQNFRKLVRWLHPTFDTLAQAPQSTLPTGSLTPLMETKHVDQEDGHNRLRTYSRYPNGTYDRLTAHVSDLAWGRHWYLPRPIVRGEPTTARVVRWLRQVGLLLVLGAVLYVLLRILARRVFNLDLLSLKNLVRQTTGPQHQQR